VCAFILALGLAAAWGAQPTTGGKVTGAVFFAFFIALCGFLWWYQNRQRSRIQLTGWTSATSHGAPYSGRASRAAGPSL
jgi:hypothetical protein